MWQRMCHGLRGWCGEGNFPDNGRIRPSGHVLEKGDCGRCPAHWTISHQGGGSAVELKDTLVCRSPKDAEQVHPRPCSRRSPGLSENRRRERPGRCLGSSNERYQAPWSRTPAGAMTDDRPSAGRPRPKPRVVASVMHKEPLVFENVELTQRSYK